MVQNASTVMAVATRSDVSVRVSGKSAGTTSTRQPNSATPWKTEASARNLKTTRSKTMSSVDRSAHAVSSTTNHALAESNVVDFQ
jgi:hypothetical protein